jgi:hypothetical protein
MQHAPVEVEVDRPPHEAVASLRRDQEKLLTFYDFPAEHWVHLRTTNVVESPFSTVRLRQRVTKGAGSRTKGLIMAFKLLEMAEKRWRRLNAPHLVPLVRAGVKFVDGVQMASRPLAGRPLVSPAQVIGNIRVRGSHRPAISVSAPISRPKSLA